MHLMGFKQSQVHFAPISFFNKRISRFLFYMVNPGEGFNLRRDVFSRIAVMTKHLNQEKKYAYTLVNLKYCTSL